MADKILEELRIRLRDGLTSAVMKNLVDELRDKKVLNKEESEDILHQMKRRSDQARDLIDSVKMKGSKASEILFESLQRHDETLYQNLEINDRLEAPPRAAATSSVRQATPADHKTKCEQNPEKEEYKMESIPRGFCVIINNKNFKKPQKERKGSDFDVASLKDVFKFLGFEVKDYQDLTADEIKSLMAQYSKSDRHGDCFVCCVLSHGNQCGVLGKDEKCCLVKDIKLPFDGVNCPSLIDKPKVFFIQACRGREMQSKVKVKTDGDGEPDQESHSKPIDEYSIPKDSDFLTVMSTVEGCYSIRDEDSGSWFIQSLCSHLKDGSKWGQDILKILTNVNNDVSRKEGIVKINNKIIDAKMVPEPQFILRKTLIFRVPEGGNTSA